MKYLHGMDNSEPHESYSRLLLAAKKLKGWNGDAEIIRGLASAMPPCEVSAQRIGNWRKRGVAKDALVDMCNIIGCRPAWIQDGSGIMEDIGAGHADADISEAISMLSDLHGRLRTKAVTLLERDIKELMSVHKANAAQ